MRQIPAHTHSARPNADARSSCARALILFLSVWLLAGCAGGDPALFPNQPGQQPAEIVLLDNHWHTNLILRTADLPTDLRTQLPEYAANEYVMIGWGDEGFYRASAVTSGLVPQALFFSRGSVLRVDGFDGPPEEWWASTNDVYRIPTSRASLQKVIDHVARSFQRDAGGHLIDGGTLPYNARFYLALGRYGVFHTCNQWTARALHDAGLPVTPFYASTAWNLAFQLRQIDGVIKNRRPLVRHRTPAVPERLRRLRRLRGGRA